MTRLRLHLVGRDEARKAEMASALRTALNRRRRLDIVVVPPLREAGGDRPDWDIGRVMALESEYLRYEAGRQRARHLLFVDSAVDRLVRAAESGVDLALYFLPRLVSSSAERGTLFLYGPEPDEARSSFLARHRIPVQFWSEAEACVEAAVEAVMLALRGEDGE